MVTKSSVKITTKKVSKKKELAELEEIDLSLNDLLLRGRVSAVATTKELPSGDKVVTPFKIRQGMTQWLPILRPNCL